MTDLFFVDAEFKSRFRLAVTVEIGFSDLDLFLDAVGVTTAFRCSRGRGRWRRAIRGGRRWHRQIRVQSEEKREGEEYMAKI